MISRLVYLLSCSVGLGLLQPHTIDTFLFPFCPEKIGENNNGRVTFNTRGLISKDQKTVHIPITINYCMIMTEVRVEVDNPVGPPIVRLDRDLHVVTIQYRAKQASISNYLVTAKAVPNKNCSTTGAGLNSSPPPGRRDSKLYY